jgi:hypothetical protein
MFSGAEMTRGNLGTDRDKVKAALTTFSGEVRNACFARRLGIQHVPFARPTNFIAILDPQALHIVVDDVPVGGIPDHTYIDRRQEKVVLPLDALIGAAVREFGFREPIGVTLPIQSLDDNEPTRQAILAPIAQHICGQLIERARVRELNLPQGYEHFARYFRVPA